MITDLPVPRSNRPRNLILSRLPEEQFQALVRFLIPVELPLNMQLSLPNQVVESIYFPISGLISTDALTEKGESVEVGLVGREGFSGLCALLGHPQMSHSVVMQGAGAGFRIRASILREEFLKGGPFAQMVYDFAYMQMVQMTQSVLCNRMHAVEARLARWLLTSADRTESNELMLTQEFLAQMLGSRRSTVTVAARTSIAPRWVIVPRRSVVARRSRCVSGSKASVSERLPSIASNRRVG